MPATGPDRSVVRVAEGPRRAFIALGALLLGGVVLLALLRESTPASGLVVWVVLIAYNLLLRIDVGRSAVRSVSFAPGEVAVEGSGDSVEGRWAGTVAAVGTRGSVVRGVLVERFNPTRRSALVLLDDLGRVIDAPQVSWVRVADLEAACHRSGLGWAGALDLLPIPSVPVPPPEWDQVAIPPGPVADDERAIAELRRPSTAKVRSAARVALSAAAVGGFAALNVVMGVLSPLVAIALSIGAMALLSADLVVERIRRRAALRSLRGEPEVIWSTAECIVLDVPPRVEDKTAVIVLAPGGATVTSVLRLHDLPDWIRVRRRLWLLIAVGAEGHGVVALPDRSRLAVVASKPFSAAVGQGWLSGPDAAACAAGGLGQVGGGRVVV